MKKRSYTTLRIFLPLIIAIASLIPSRALATHFFGVDLAYTNTSGNTYSITLTVWGDCAGAAFQNLLTAVPRIDIYNGNTFSQSTTLTLQAPLNGIEVTPVCPSQINNTTCTNVNNPVPGIKKFVYTGSVTLTGTSSVWRFLFNGYMGVGNSAGRSNSITNIFSGTVISLVDTLNNIAAPNSSPALTTIPTPFYCLNVPATYNSGAVDPNNDSLTFFLVPGIDANTGSSVNYINPYTYAAPLATLPGSFSFSSFTGQLSFTPNALQKSLVVYNVEERRNNVLVGTSQREMTFVVLSCNNYPPFGGIVNTTAGTIIDSTDLSICQAVGPFSFHINPTDPNGDNITMTYAGLPPGASFNITNNGTTAPLGTFSWNTTGVAPDVYVFYITFQDDACPLSSKQTRAYTITVLPNPTLSYAMVSPATCVKKAVFNVIPGNGTTWNFSVLQGNNTIQTINNVTGSFLDSLLPGTYTLRAALANGCYKDTSIIIAAPPVIYPIVSLVSPTCYGGSNGSITISGSNGLAPYLYALGGGAYTAATNYTNLSAGTYTFHILDANTCSKDTTVNLLNATPTLLNVTIKKPSCNNYANGSIIITASNSVAPYQYAIGGGSFSNTNVFPALAQGTYTLHIKNAVGCLKDTTVTLIDSTELHALLTINNNLCYADSSAAVIVYGTGAYLLPYTYALNVLPFSYSNTFTNLQSGTYAIHVHDSANCYFDTTINITQPTLLAPVHTITNVLCNGDATGVITNAVSGGTPSYQYSINGGNYVTSVAFSNLIAGTYVVRTKDANGCIKADTITITQPPKLVINSVTVQQVVCYNNATGSFIINADGGTPPYTYEYNGNNIQNSNTYTNLAQGVYTIDVIDANGCVKDTTIALQNPNPVLANITVQKPSCNGFANGAIIITGYNSIAPYQYAIGGGAYNNTDTFTGLALGTYTLHVKNAVGCIIDTSITLTDSTAIHATLSLHNLSCNSDASGYVVVTATGAYLLPYTYAVNAGPFGYNDTLGNLAAGTYTIHVHDSELCHFDTAITLTQPQPINIAPAITNVPCFGGANGAITVNVSGGTPAYTYNINNGTFGNNNIFTGLTAGSYIIVIKDADNCVKPDTIPVSQPTQLLFAGIAPLQPNCNGDVNGTYTITASGGTPPYTYAYNGNAYQGSDIIGGLGAGTYTLHIKDANGCIADSTVTLLQPTQVSVTATALNATCHTLSNGSVALSGSGGSAPYTYAVNGGVYSGNASFTPLASATYTFHVKDAHGCIKDTAITITDSITVSGTLSVSPALCYSQATGSVAATPTSGISPYTFAIDAGPYTNNNTVNNLLAGYYTMHIKDVNGCIFDTIFAVVQPDNILPHTVLSNVLCYNGATGSIILSATGGTPVYTYALNSGTFSNTTVYNTLSAGTDTLHIKDNNGCLHDTVVTITQPGVFIIDSLNIVNDKCFGDSAASVIIYANGGSAPYQYQEDSTGFQVANGFSGLAAGQYIINVKDNNGCTADTGFSIIQPPPLSISAVSVVNPTCPGFKDGAAIIHATGGTLPYIYVSGNGLFVPTDSFALLAAGTYTLYVKDSNGCLRDTMVTLTGYPAIVLTRADVKGPSCYGFSDGTLTLVATGGMSPFMYHVNDYPLQDTGLYTGLAANTYTLTVTDSKNCRFDSAIVMSQPDSITLIATATNNGCDGIDNQGAVYLTVAGGTQPYTYMWNNDATLTTQNITGIANGLYRGVVIDLNNCTDSTLAQVAYDDCCKPFLPNAFTPNGDGKDDIYRIVFKGDMTLLEFSIYNRFGQRVYTTKELNAGWDGNYNGTPQNMDTYFYYARIICGNSNDSKHKITLKGDVTLIR